MDVLTWVQDSADIVHAVIKWNVHPNIENPHMLVKKYPDSTADIENIHEKFESLLTNVHIKWKDRPEASIQSKSDIQPESLHLQEELKHVSNWLDSVIKVSEGDRDVKGTKGYHSAKAKRDVFDKMNDIHTKLGSIFTKCKSLNTSDEGRETVCDTPNQGILKQENEDNQVKEKRNNESNNEMIHSKSSATEENSQPRSVGTEATQTDTKVSNADKGTQTDRPGKTETEITRDELNSNLADLQKEIKRLKVQVDELTSERDNTRIRLSQIMSAQLKNDNPGIADLSDTIRPTVIAEKYGQLYDDEWTDGFQHLNQGGRSEMESIETLLLTLTECFVFCEGQEKVQGKKVVSALVSLESKQPSNNAEKVPKGPDDLFTDAKNTLKELSRQTSGLSKETIINEYFKAKEQSLDKGLTPYIEKCLELCWYMVLQSPPVYLDSEQSDSNKKGSLFNKDLFRHYSRTGKKLDFIVWPPLYLYKGGPLLAKGVAQPIPI